MLVLHHSTSNLLSFWLQRRSDDLNRLGSLYLILSDMSSRIGRKVLTEKMHPRPPQIFLGDIVFPVTTSRPSISSRHLVSNAQLFLAA